MPVGGNPDGLSDALRLAGCGLAVIPIPHGRKHPQLPQWQKAATTDADTVRSWWGGLYRGQGVGIAPRHMADGRWLVVIDLDRHDPGADGCDTWADLCDAYGDAPTTVEATTGGGGTHLLFGTPFEVRNNAGTLGPGVDVRGVGGQIVVEPTVHPSGGSYAWVEGQEPWAHEIADAPRWLCAMLKPAEPDTSLRVARHGGAERSDRPGDEWAKTVTWDELLSRDGWTLHRRVADGSSLWTRPGKDVREGPSASVGFGGSDVMKVFTTSMAHVGLECESTYTKLGYFTAVHHDGNFRAAATALASEGFGEREGLSLTALQGISADPWPEPAVIERNYELLDFPIEALPRWCVDYVGLVAREVSVPVDLAATLCIGALSGAALGRAKVIISDAWAEPVALYLVNGFKSGGGKSPTSKRMCGWLSRWEADRIEAARARWEEGQITIQFHQKAINRAQNGAIPDLAAALSAKAALRAAEEEYPPLPRLLMDDVTPEAVVSLLHRYNERMAITSTEADLFDMLLKGRTGQRQNMNVFLKAWSGDAMSVDRKGSSETGPQAISLREPTMSISVSAQPSVLERLVSDSEMVSRGFVARFMPSVPVSNIGARDLTHKYRPSSNAERVEYERRCVELATRWATWQNPAHLRMSSGAVDVFMEFETFIESLLGPGGEFEHLEEWVAKIHASATRYAGLLHLAEGIDTNVEISRETALRAIELEKYWISHAHSLVKSGEITRVSEQADAIAAWAMSKSGGFSSTELLKECRRPGVGLLAIRDYIPALELLVELGWLRAGDDWAGSLGVKGSKAAEFAVNPGLADFGGERSVSRVSRVSRGTFSDWRPSSEGSLGFVTQSQSVSRVSRVVYKESGNTLSPFSPSAPPKFHTTRDTRDTVSTGAVDNSGDNSPTDPGSDGDDLDWMTL